MMEALEAAIERYLRIISNGGWRTVPSDRIQGDDVRLLRLRQRLIISGELSPTTGSDDYEGIHAAVRRFQTNNGLRVTGVVDIPTLQALNVPAEARLVQLRANLERLRDLIAQRVEDRYILVNVPDFQLEAVERHQVEQRHRIVAGKPERPTPTIRATIRALNFFPFWRVPESVATHELIPRLIREPDYLRNEQIKVRVGSYDGSEIDPSNIDWRQADTVKLRFRQDPGPLNVLGFVRFDMPNEHGVYMHDTPTKQLFDRRDRAFSAGCVRVQDVSSLAEWVARYEPGWEQAGRVSEVHASGNALDVRLTRPVPVYFAYITAWAEPNGTIQFRPDIYGRDGIGQGQERGQIRAVSEAGSRQLDAFAPCRAPRSSRMRRERFTARER
jgi:murein L,D-transpeptidase YcbB/YkuD